MTGILIAVPWIEYGIAVQTDSPLDIEEFDSAEDFEEPRTFGPMALWLGVLGLAVLFIPLYLTSNTLETEIVRLEGEVVPLQTALASTPLPLADAQELIPTLTAVHNNIAQIEEIMPILAADHVDWSAAMAAVGAMNANGVQLSGLEQAGNQLILRGRAQNSDQVTTYARQLELSGQFTQVEVRSIIQVAEPFLSPTPTPLLPTNTPTRRATSTPTRTAVPTAVPSTPKPTWTPTPKLTDDYEWDDTTPKPIFVGAPAQLHNFYPDMDVDHVTFLAKAGRTYEVSTDLLAPGVDTILTVTIGETSLTNDDAALGQLSSSVTVQAPSEGDVQVLVQVTNRGVFGPDKWYDLLVREIVPTDPTASLTPTSAPPTLTPSPTADLRDIHEPNDIDPNPIAIGESQGHNFFPTGDIDNVGFLVKNGRFYQLLTSQLAVGVDTAVTLNFNGQSWSNDDYDLPGSDNFASAVCFPAEADGTAVATINNLGQQYGPAKTYTVSVQEVPFLTAVPDEIEFGSLTEGGGNPAPQLLQIEGTEPLDWTATTETPWLTTDVVTGTTPSTLTVSADIAGLAPGQHEGEIILGWADFCREIVPVTIQINPLRSALPNSLGRSWPVAKIGQVQVETVEFVIVLTLRSVGP